MKMNNGSAIVLMAAAVAFASCSAKEEPEVSSSEDKVVYDAGQKMLANIQTGSLEYRLISSVVSCTGEVEVPPQGMASVTAPLGGYIAGTTMVPGKQVKKGTLLATLSNPEYIVLQQTYLETSGELKFAEQEYERQKTLEKQNATAVKNLQESESAFTVLKARLAGLKAQLRLIGVDMENLEQGNIQSVVILRAPIAGYVTAVNNHPGEFVEPREVIFEIVNMDDLHLHLNIFEQDIIGIRKGQHIQFRPTGENSASYEGRVSLVSPKRNDDARSFDIHGHIETGQDNLKPGMHVEADILLSADSVPSLPESALVYQENRSFIITDDHGSYSIVPVEVGTKMDGWVEIVNHTDLINKSVVTQGASRLFAAMRRAK